MNNQVSKEAQATQHVADRQAARANRLLGEGLRRLREGKAPTKIQLPFVAAWMAEHDNEVKHLKEALEDAQIDKGITERHYRRLIPKHNAVLEVLREFGIRLYSKGDDNHGWEGETGDLKGGQEGYGSFEEALREALQWRIQQNGDIMTNQETLRSLELRVVKSKHLEARLQKGGNVFVLSKGTAASDERWHLYTANENYYGDSIDEVLDKAEQDYPLIKQWASEWRTE